MDRLERPACNEETKQCTNSSRECIIENATKRRMMPVCCTPCNSRASIVWLWLRTGVTPMYPLGECKALGRTRARSFRPRRASMTEGENRETSCYFLRQFNAREVNGEDGLQGTRVQLRYFDTKRGMRGPVSLDRVLRHKSKIRKETRGSRQDGTLYLRHYEVPSFQFATHDEATQIA